MSINKRDGPILCEIMTGSSTLLRDSCLFANKKRLGLLTLRLINQSKNLPYQQLFS